MDVILHANIYNLDNSLGKMEHMNKGAYTVLYSYKDEIALVRTPIEIKEMKPTVITLPELQKYFLPQLKEIETKEQDLRSRGHITAADCALNLHNTLKEKHNEFVEGKIDTQTFKNSCTDAINTARPELEKHRGWKQVLGNLALAVVGLGVLYVVAGLINKVATGSFLFFKTDSANKLDKLDQAIGRHFTVRATSPY